MESVLNLIVNAENVRMLVTLAFVCCAYVLMKSQMKDMVHSINKRIDGVEVSIKELSIAVNGRIDELSVAVNGRIDELSVAMNGRIDELSVAMNGRINELSIAVNGRIDELKYNDFAHLNSTIEALTYALEKNGALQKEDKDYVDSRLAH